MARQSKECQHSDAIHDEAVRIARGIQRPGQTKVQTKLIAQGIQKGIEIYKRQHSAKARELDKRRKKNKRQVAQREIHEVEIQEKVIYRQHWLPWVLLVLSWMAIGVYFLV